MIPLQTIAAALAFDHCTDPLVRAAGSSPADADDFADATLEAALHEHGINPVLVDALRDALRVELAKAAA